MVQLSSTGKCFSFFFIWEMKTRQVIGRYLSIHFLLFSFFLFFLIFFAMSLYVMDGTYGSFFFLPQICLLYFVRKDTGRETLAIVSVLVFPLH